MFFFVVVLNRQGFQLRMGEACTSRGGGSPLTGAAQAKLSGLVLGAVTVLPDAVAVLAGGLLSLLVVVDQLLQSAVLLVLLGNQETIAD